MPPKKRTSTVANADATEPSAKRTRKLAETAASTRPKRIPQLPPRAAKTKVTAPAKSTTVSSSNAQDTPRKRGRPAGKSASTVKGETGKSSIQTPVKKSAGRGRPKGSTTPKTTSAGKLAKRRGRPPKSPLPSSTETTGKKRKRTTGVSKKGSEGLPKKTLGRPAKKQTTTKSPRKPSYLKEKEPDLTIEVAEENAFGPDGQSYWLMKAEPESRLVKGVDVKFSIDDLRAAEVPEPWDGVRNPVARNNMRAMKQGDYAFFYHSSCKVPGIVGLMEIVKEHSVDESAFDPSHPYYDEKSSRENPKWEVVHVEFRRKFGKTLTLETLKSHGVPGQPLENLQTLRQSRVSVSRVTPQEWDFIMSLIDDDPDFKEDIDEEVNDVVEAETEAVDSEPAAVDSTSEPMLESGSAPTTTATNEEALNDLSQPQQEENGTKEEDIQVNGKQLNENGINGQTTTERLASVITGAFLTN